MSTETIIALVFTFIGAAIFFIFALARMKVVNSTILDLKRKDDDHEGRLQDLEVGAEAIASLVKDLTTELDTRCPVQRPEACAATPEEAAPTEVDPEETAPVLPQPPPVPAARAQPQPRISARRPSVAAPTARASVVVETGSGNGGMMIGVLIAVALACIGGTYLIVRSGDKADSKKTKTTAALVEKDKVQVAAPTVGFDCSPCEQLPLPTGTFAALENVNGVPTWNVQCGGSPGCENCAVDCRNDDATPPSNDCFCKQK